MKIIAVSQARTGSSRLPDKVLKKADGETLLQIHLNRLKKSERLSEFILATTTKVGDIIIREIAQANGIKCYQGSENDVLDRFYQAVQPLRPDYVVRLTADCPLIDAQLMDKVIDYTLANDLDYVTNTLETTYPDGQDVEVFKFSALEEAWYQAKLKSEREHVTPYIRNNSDWYGKGPFKAGNFTEGFDYGHLRMTVDEQADLELIRQLISQLGKERAWLDYALLQDSDTEISAINSGILRNEGLLKSLQND